MDIEKMMTTIRAGGNEGSLAFFKIATETFQRSGGAVVSPSGCVKLSESFRSKTKTCLS